MSAAARAFDTLAPYYDVLFTESHIGRAQRRAVWRVLERTFRPGERVLELNCGTGKDALFLAARGVSVVACDASPGMISVACRRRERERISGKLELMILPTEQLSVLAKRPLFDGVFSNFAGLNCVEDLASLARQLRAMTRPAARVLLCMSTRYCLWEFCWYAAQGKFAKATRRWVGRTEATIAGNRVPVWYPTVRELCRAFRPGFSLRRIRAVGLTVPPSYLEALAARIPAALSTCEELDRVLAGVPGLRTIGDHVLLELVRDSV